MVWESDAIAVTWADSLAQRSDSLTGFPAVRGPLYLDSLLGTQRTPISTTLVVMGEIPALPVVRVTVLHAKRRKNLTGQTRHVELQIRAIQRLPRGKRRGLTQ